MRWVRLLLFPFSVLYGWIVFVRNWLFDTGVFKSTSYEFPVICVGNLSVGGTGKSPMIEYLIRFLKDSHHLATLSRGYKRKTTAFLVATPNTTAEDIGDEPLQFYKKFGDDIIVSVEAKRTLGIEKLRNLATPPQVILLDDAFQHRYVSAGFSIILTPYNDLYVNDWMLPTGNLREPISGAKRADVIIVTKCPQALTEREQTEIKKKLQPKIHQEVFFTSIRYSEVIYNETAQLSLTKLASEPFVLITGIANPAPLKVYLNEHQLSYTHLKFPDHHNFSESELKTIQQKAKNKRVLTTEKDFMRLQGKIENLYYLPIEVMFLADEQLFKNQVNAFVKR